MLRGEKDFTLLTIDEAFSYYEANENKVVTTNPAKKAANHSIISVDSMRSTDERRHCKDKSVDSQYQRS